MTHNPPPVISENIVPSASQSSFPKTGESSEPPSANLHSKEKKGDDVFNYNCALLADGLFFLNFLDAVSEGDGLRIMRQYKYMLLYCRADGHHSNKYALMCLYQSFYINSLLSQETVKGSYGTVLSTTREEEATISHMIWRWSTATCTIKEEYKILAQMSPRMQYSKFPSLKVQ